MRWREWECGDREADQGRIGPRIPAWHYPVARTRTPWKSTGFHPERGRRQGALRAGTHEVGS
jgi:hypothetical protein